MKEKKVDGFQVDGLTGIEPVNRYPLTSIFRITRQNPAVDAVALGLGHVGRVALRHIFLDNDPVEDVAFVQMGFHSFVGGKVSDDTGNGAAGEVATDAVPVDDAFDVCVVCKRYAGDVAFRVFGVVFFAATGPKSNTGQSE